MFQAGKSSSLRTRYWYKTVANYETSNFVMKMSSQYVFPFWYNFDKTNIKRSALSFDGSLVTKATPKKIFFFFS